MKILASTITLTTHIVLDEDGDDIKPEHNLQITIEESAGFLANQRGVLAAWLRTAANGLDGGETTEEG